MSTQYVIPERVQKMIAAADEAALRRRAAQHTFDTFSPLEHHQIGQSSLVERFSAVANIKNAIIDTYTQPNGAVIISPNAIVQQTELLFKILGTIDFSKEYKNLVLKVTRQSISELFQNTDDVKKLLEWKDQERFEQRRLLQSIHNRMMYNLRWELGDAIPMVDDTSFADLTLFEAAKQQTPHSSSFNFGSAGTEVGKRYIKLNAHNDAAFDTLREPVNTVAHETSHIFEDVLRQAWAEPKAVNMPHWLRGDMETCHLHQVTGAYIPSSMQSTYRFQFNEALAWKVGEAAENQLRDCLAYAQVAQAVPIRPVR